MGGIRDRRARQQEAIDNGEPLRTKKGRKKKGQEKRGIERLKHKTVGERIGKGVLNPAPTFGRASVRIFGAGERDRKTTERVMGYTYDGLTLGVAPVARLSSDEARSREGQKRKKKKKHKHKHKK
jgi:hypothetical protein